MRLHEVIRQSDERRRIDPYPSTALADVARELDAQFAVAGSQLGDTVARFLIEVGAAAPEVSEQVSMHAERRRIEAAFPCRREKIGEPRIGHQRRRLRLRLREHRFHGLSHIAIRVHLAEQLCLIPHSSEIDLQIVPDRERFER
ncbi:hypothetical protein [Microbacterium phyllosphaerae]